MIRPLFFCLLLLSFSKISAQPGDLQTNNMVWHTPSNNSAESMPCGGGDIGLNVWVEKGDLLFYIARSGTYDENNALLKLCRVRLHLSPNPFEVGNFKQELKLNQGCVEIEGGRAGQITRIKLWVDVFSPEIHAEIQSDIPVKLTAGYESWRFADKPISGLENNENGYKFGAVAPVTGYKDRIAFRDQNVVFYHQNRHAESIFDVTVRQQGLEKVKDQLDDPLKNLIFGGLIGGVHLKPAGKYNGMYLNTPFQGWKLGSSSAFRSYQINIRLLTGKYAEPSEWQSAINKPNKRQLNLEKIKAENIAWWKQFWQRSFVYINPNQPDTASAAWQSGRNYQLFRYMLACNVSGSYPTKFNGGLFTYDPALVNPQFPYTPDFRNWGGSVFTAQNQRLVYYPMLKNGDFDLLKPQLNFYLGLLHNAEIATRTYWPHGGARFPEQLENFGLSDYAEYGINRPESANIGVDYNPWLEYHWETVLEFCYMMLENSSYSGEEVKPYLNFIESCIDFFDQHYQYLAGLRGTKVLDGNGHLILFPGSAGETFKMAYNSTPTVAGLNIVLKELLNLPAGTLTQVQRNKFMAQLREVPPIAFQYINGYKTIAPAKSWERINNEESPQLYPVFPYSIYGLQKPDMDVAINTWNLDTNVVKFRSYLGWKQDNIIAARLGLAKEAAALTFAKLKNSGRRFPAFWGPGFDWTPDHNWGGSGMMGLQEMLLQTAGNKILLLPSWPGQLDVHFKLWAPRQTTVECTFINGKVAKLTVLPRSRLKDVVLALTK